MLPALSDGHDGAVESPGNLFVPQGAKQGIFLDRPLSQGGIELWYAQPAPLLCHGAFGPAQFQRDLAIGHLAEQLDLRWRPVRARRLA